MHKEHVFYRPAVHVLLIVLLGLMSYSNTFNVPFVFDDEPNIINNPAVKDFVFFKDTAKLINIPMEEGVRAFFKSRYVGYLTFAVNYKLHGFAVFGYHVVNLLIHIMNALLVYWLIIFTLKTPFFIGDHDQSNKVQFHSLIGFFAALFFVVHPIQTQAVTYVVQRFASLATLFYLISLVLYIKSRCSESPGARFTLYALSIVSAILAMKTKEISFTLPIAISIYEFSFFQGKINKRLLYLLPFILTMLIIPLTLMDFGGMRTDARSIEEVTTMANKLDISRGDYLITQARVMITYLRLLFVPVMQNIDYDYPIYHSFLAFDVVLSLLILVMLIIVGGYLYSRSRSVNIENKLMRLISFGIFFFFLAISVESSLIPITDVIFEHRLYLPSIGFFIAIISSLFLVKEKLSRKTVIGGRIFIYALIMILVVFSGATYARNTVWQDESRLWEDAVKKSPNKARPHNNFGLAYDKKGDVVAALKEYRLALKLEPDYEGVHLNIGTIYYKQNLLDDALREYKAALKLKPKYAKAHNNIGNVYFKQGRFNQALQEYRMALSIKPDYAIAHNNLANVYGRLGQYDAALVEYRLAIKIVSGYAEAHNNLANLYFKLGKYDEAIREYQAVSVLSPDYVGVYNSIGNVYLKMGRLSDALREYQTAVRLKPDYTEARRSLELVQKKMRGSDKVSR